MLGSNSLRLFWSSLRKEFGVPFYQQAHRGQNSQAQYLKPVILLIDKGWCGCSAVSVSSKFV